MDFRKVETLIRTRFQVRNRDNPDDIVDFVPNPAQARLLQLCQKLQDEDRRLRIISVKSRRVGFSRIIEAISCCYMFAYPNFEGRIMAHYDETALDILSSAALMVYGDGEPGKGLPWRGKREIWDPTNEYKAVVVPHKAKRGHAASRLSRASAKVRGKGRGLGFSFYHGSEAAYYPEDSPFTAVLPALAKSPSRSFAALESTGNGVVGDGEAFYKYWQQASDPDKLGDSEWVRFFVPWTEDPYAVSRQTPSDIPRDDEERVLLKIGLSKHQIAWRRFEIATTYQGIVEDFNVECLTADALISTRRGLLPIVEVRAGDRTEANEIVALTDKGIRPTVTATTTAGRRIIGTYEHPLEKADGGFVGLGSAAGLRIKLSPPIFRQQYQRTIWREQTFVLDEEMGLFLGLFVGDGSFYASSTIPSTVSLRCDPKDTDVLTIAEALWDRLFGKHSTRSNNGAFEIRAYARDFAQLLDWLGCYNPTPPYKRIAVPQPIFQSPQYVVRAFLRGLFEADGYNGPKWHSVQLHSKSGDFVRQIQLLLLGFGIDSRITAADKPSLNYKGFRLTLNSSASQAFNEKIGFVGARKQSASIKSGFADKGRTGRPARPFDGSDTILRVEPAGDAHVYDLALASQPNTFSANGFSVHNCPLTPEDAFLSGGFPAFAHDEREYAMATVREPVLTAELERTRDPWLIKLSPLGRRGRLRIWELPKPRMEYYIGVDLARGEDMKKPGAPPGDYAAITVFNGSTGEQAAGFYDRIDPAQMANVVDMLGRYYRTPEISPNHCAMLNIEVNANLGAECQRILRDRLSYPVWRFARWRGSKDDRYNRKSGTAIGWETTQNSRKLMFAAFRTSLRQKEVCIRDEELAGQLVASTMTDGRWEITHGHDDYLASCLFAWMSRQQYPPRTIAPRKDFPADQPHPLADLDIRDFQMEEALARTEGKEMDELLPRDANGRVLPRRQKRDPLDGVIQPSLLG